MSTSPRDFNVQIMEKFRANGAAAVRSNACSEQCAMSNGNARRGLSAASTARAGDAKPHQLAMYLNRTLRGISPSDVENRAPAPS